MRQLVLRDCELADAEACVLAEMLTCNHTVEKVDLQQNKITAKGAIELARGLSRNHGVQTLNLANQKVNVVLGEECLERFKAMFETNVTLTKLNCHFHSSKAWELAALVTRNVEIQRRVAHSMSYSDLLPSQKRRFSMALTQTPPTVSPADSEGTLVGSAALDATCAKGDITPHVGVRDPSALFVEEDPIADEFAEEDEEEGEHEGEGGQECPDKGEDEEDQCSETWEDPGKQDIVVAELHERRLEGTEEDEQVGACATIHARKLLFESLKVAEVRRRCVRGG